MTTNKICPHKKREAACVNTLSVERIRYAVSFVAKSIADPAPVIITGSPLAIASNIVKLDGRGAVSNIGDHTGELDQGDTDSENKDIGIPKRDTHTEKRESMYAPEALCSVGLHQTVRGSIQTSHAVQRPLVHQHHDVCTGKRG
jgi:hypothetical protein